MQSNNCRRPKNRRISGVDMRLSVAYPILCAYTVAEHVNHVLRS